MPKIELTRDELIVRLNLWEMLLSMHSSLRIPLEAIRGATDDEGFRGLAFGFRAPGTSIPGLISAGTYWRGQDRQFVFVTRGSHPVVIELAHKNLVRIVLGVLDARREAARINAAVGERP
jgi:hypothetical protein